MRNIKKKKSSTQGATDSKKILIKYLDDYLKFGIVVPSLPKDPQQLASQFEKCSLLKSGGATLTTSSSSNATILLDTPLKKIG